MRIVIPSRSRPDSIVTLNFIPQPWRRQVVIVVPQQQFHIYEKYNTDVTVVSCPVKTGIAPTRQWIIENFKDKHIFMCDDDAIFAVRKDPNSTKLTPMEDDVNGQMEMWTTVEEAFLLGFPWVGISYRGGNNFYKTNYEDNTKSFSFWGVDREVLLREGIRFDVTPVMEDFQVILSLLSRGYENRVFYKWAWDQESSNAPGGCSDWRTQDVQAEGATKLQQLFPDYVKVVYKQPKIGWYNGEPRADVRIQWKKTARWNGFLK